MAVTRTPNSMSGATNVADLLERVLDKGVVIAGDVKISLLDIELLTIQLRLVICSIDKAKEMGMDWWANSPVFGNNHTSAQTPDTNQLPAATPSTALPGQTAPPADLDALQDRVKQLEQALADAKSLTETLTQQAAIATPGTQPAPQPEPQIPQPRRFRPVTPPPEQDA